MTNLEQMKETLEKAIDDSSLDTVLELIGTICGEKAEHIETNWQDTSLAATWARAGAQIEALAALLSNMTEVLR